MAGAIRARASGVMSRVFVDTNVWVYAVDNGEPDKQAQALHVLEPTNGKDLVLSAQVLGEFYVTVTRKFAENLTETEAVALVDRMRQLPIIPVDANLVAGAIANAREWQISYWDGLIVTAAQTSGCDTVLSEDLPDGQMYGSVRVENPFRLPSGSP